MVNWLQNTFPSLFGKTKLTTAVIDYLPNDPFTPNLTTKITVPMNSGPPVFAVQGWNGTVISDNQKQAAQVYTTLTLVSNLAHRLLNQPLTKWAATNILIVVPRAGQQLNAFYDRSSLKFFYDRHITTGKIVFTCESNDVVAHEFGHALLDAIRPDLWSAQSLEIFAFHEAFGDIMAILSAMQHDVIIDYVIRETIGSIRSSNILSRVGEEIGNAIFCKHISGTATHNSLRDAANDFKYIRPELLPRATSDNGLCQESHNFSRVFTGAWYQCLAAVYNDILSSNMSPHDALKTASEVMGKITLNSLPLAAANPRFYNSITRAMLIVAQSYEQGHYVPILRKVFLERKLTDDIPMAHHGKMYLGKNKGQTIGDKKIIREGGIIKKRLCDIQSDKLKISHTLPIELLKAQLNIPGERYLLVDKRQRVIDELPIDQDDLHNSTISALTFLHQGNLINNDPLDEQSQFRIINGELTRLRSCLDKRLQYN